MKNDAIHIIWNDEALMKAFNYLIDNGTGNMNPYHNINHLLTAVKYAGHAARSERLSDYEKRHLYFAALLHDIDHSAGETNDTDNVIRSKTIALRILVDLKITDIDIDLINEILDATEYPYVIEADKLTLIQKIMRDVDMCQMFESNWLHQIIYGIAEEAKIEFDAMLINQKKFATGVRYNTNWGKNTLEPLRLKHIELLDKLIYIRELKNCSHSYSKSMNEPRPRLCVKCGEPEICQVCLGNGDIHICGKTESDNPPEIIRGLKNLHARIECLILNTPTGKERNKLTDENIALLYLIETLGITI